MAMANPLHCQRENPTIRMTNSSHPQTDIKGKGNPYLSLVCLNYWLPIVALSLCFNHLVLSAIQVRYPQEIC